MLLFFLLLLFVEGVSGAETDESVMEGDSVTLHTDITEIQNDDTILWLFGPRDSVISQITRKADFTSFFVTDDAGFTGRLQVDQKTGSLTIRNTRIRHSGRYKLSVSREKTTTKIFNVNVFAVAGGTDGVKSESVMEGKSVTLQNNVEVQREDLIVWRFGDEGILLAKIDLETKEILLNDADERFRDRLQLNQNGSLIIKQTKTEHTGLYELQIRGRESDQRFLLTVTAVAGPGLSPGVLAGIVAAALLVVASVAIYYRFKYRRKYHRKYQSELGKYPVNKSVLKGDSVTLFNNTAIQKDDKIQWKFGEKPIAEMTGRNRENPQWTDEFRGQMKLDPLTGSLIIQQTRSEHSGLYKLEIKTRDYSRVFRLIVCDEMKLVSVMKEADETLRANTEIQTGDKIFWMFGDHNWLIDKNTEEKCEESECSDSRFKDRVDLNHQTGDLTIKKIETNHTGKYKLKIIKNGKSSFKIFRVTVSGNTSQTEPGPNAADSDEIPAAGSNQNQNTESLEMKLLPKQQNQETPLDSVVSQK